MPEKPYSELELLFIKEQLYVHSEELTDLFVADIERKNLFKSGDLLSVFESGSPYKVWNSSGSVVLSMKFPDYGRFIEINFHKKLRTENNKDNAKKWGAKEKEKAKANSKRKNTDWYTRNVYGSQNLLIGRLMWGLGDIEIQRLKNILEKEKK
jgi:hypothetical protein